MASSHGQRSVVGQRVPGRHLVDVGRRVEVVALGVRNAEPGREQGTDRGLPGACDAHDHDDVGGTSARALASSSTSDVDALKRIRYDEFKSLGHIKSDFLVVVTHPRTLSSMSTRGRGLHGHVLETLGPAITAGEYPPGSVLRTDELAQRFEVSRSVMREAVRVLESMHLVESRRRVGVTVRPKSEWNVYDPQVIRWRLAGADRPQQLRSLTVLRSAIEPVAAGLAATSATAEQCARAHRVRAGHGRHLARPSAGGLSRPRRRVPPGDP